MRIPVLCLLTLCTLSAFGQVQVAPTTKPDPVALLNEVAQNYARAKTYHIEEIEETVRMNPQYHDWEKTYLTAIQGTGNRFRFQIKTRTETTWLQISDGKTEWLYAGPLDRYMEQPASPDGPSMMARAMGFGAEIEQSKSIVRTLEASTARLDSIVFLQDETLTLNGHAYPCYVVHDSRQKPVPYEGTFWIDKQNRVIRKIVGIGNAYRLGDDSFQHPIFTTATTTIYPVVELDGNDPANTFLFTPPPDAKKVASFDPPGFRLPPQPATTLLNQPAPTVDFVASNGKTTSLASYRGKPVLIEFWATWCAPCMESMPQLSHLEEQLHAKGVAFISIDEDENAHSAEKYLTRHQYKWTNYHDQSGALQKAFQRKVIPLTVLIDSNGKIVFYKNNWSDRDLRSTIARLGPQYASFMPE